MDKGEQMYQTALMNSENVDMDLVYDAIDSFKRASSLSYEFDAEIEAKSCALLGKVFY